MYVNPIGIAMRDITSDKVVANASDRSPTCTFLGRVLVADSKTNSNDDEPMKKRMKVPKKQTTTFRRLWEVPLLADNLLRTGASPVRRYLGKLVLGSRAAS